MDFLKWVAAIILVIMTCTWSKLSVDAGIMLPVTDNFLAVAGTLVSIVAGQGVKNAWDKRPALK